MTRQHLSALQHADRKQIIEKLSGAGWEGSGWNEMFESGISLTPEVLATRKSALVELQFEWFAREACVKFEIAMLDASRSVRFVFHPGRNLIVLLDAITRAQDGLSLATYADWVKSVIPICERTELETPTGLVRLT